MKKVTDYLLQLGFTEIEAEIYQGLLETGPTTIMALSVHIGIKRITTHFNVESLIAKGLITQTIQGARRQIIAESPERLDYFIEQKIKRAKALQVGFPDFLSTIKAVSPQAPKSKEVEIKYYEGKQAVNHIYEEGLNAKEFRAYVNCHELSKVFPENENRFLEAHNKKNDMNIWEIMENSPEAREYIKKIPKKRYYHKFIPEGMNLSIIDYIIFDGKVAIVNLEKHTTGVLISNEHYYNNAKALFEFVWQMLP